MRWCATQYTLDGQEALAHAAPRHMLQLGDTFHCGALPVLMASWPASTEAGSGLECMSGSFIAPKSLQSHKNLLHSLRLTKKTCWPPCLPFAMNLQRTLDDRLVSLAYMLPCLLCPFHASAAICYDDHDRGEMFVVSQCGHMLCRDAARLVALAAIKCARLLLSPQPPCLCRAARSHTLATPCCSKRSRHGVHAGDPGASLWVTARVDTEAR